MPVHALFVGGVIDNTEIDLEGGEPPVHYPPGTGSGQPRYRLQAVGRDWDQAVYAVYGAPDLPVEEVLRIIDERAYVRRFGAEAQVVD